MLVVKLDTCLNPECPFYPCNPEKPSFNSKLHLACNNQPKEWFQPDISHVFVLDLCAGLGFHEIKNSSLSSSQNVHLKFSWRQIVTENQKTVLIFRLFSNSNFLLILLHRLGVSLCPMT